MKRKEKLSLYGKARGRLITKPPIVFKDKTKYDRKALKAALRKETPYD